jgi:hypothetical protein
VQSKNGNDTGFDDESDRHTALETSDAQARTNIVAPPSTQ